MDKPVSTASVLTAESEGSTGTSWVFSPPTAGSYRIVAQLGTDPVSSDPGGDGIGTSEQFDISQSNEPGGPPVVFSNPPVPSSQTTSSSTPSQQSQIRSSTENTSGSSTTPGTTTRQPTSASSNLSQSTSSSSSSYSVLPSSPTASSPPSSSSAPPATGTEPATISKSVTDTKAIIISSTCGGTALIILIIVLIIIKRRGEQMKTAQQAQYARFYEDLASLNWASHSRVSSNRSGAALNRHEERPSYSAPSHYTMDPTISPDPVNDTVQDRSGDSSTETNGSVVRAQSVMEETVIDVDPDSELPPYYTN
ncbi:hypothetical protein K435DRAFT_856742 [Dendrothele bispora CBS 962.96]|uniref:Uncharacterized protein n=1 Tax=Dendrothele bispora (strain CBS 962.96) TaxID=1314807 RepID=A0A4V4HGD7_DENBC|nr:hypothetical protein K435DRAFT_856742 [Dendrothele bispora CBS 962.96]